MIFKAKLLISGGLASVLVLGFSTKGYTQSAASSSAGISQPSAQAEASTSAGSLDIQNYRQIDSTDNESNVGGTVNNVGIQNLGGLDVPGRAQQGDVVCEVPILETGLYGTQAGNNFGTVFGGLISFRIPIGSQAQINCERRQEILTYQAELDTTLNLINFCISLKERGVSLNANALPELVDTCNMID